MFVFVSVGHVRAPWGRLSRVGPRNYVLHEMHIPQEEGAIV